MGEVLPLQEHSEAEPLREPAALGDGRRTAGVGRKQVVELGPELGGRPRGAELGLELDECGHERLGDEAAPELAEAPQTLRLRADGDGDGGSACGHVVLLRRPGAR